MTFVYTIGDIVCLLAVALMFLFCACMAGLWIALKVIEWMTPYLNRVVRNITQR